MTDETSEQRIDRIVKKILADDLRTAPEYSAPWTGQDGLQWREVRYYLGNGQWRTFLQHFIDGEWQGW